MRSNSFLPVLLLVFLLPVCSGFGQQPGVLSIKYIPLKSPYDYTDYVFTDIRRTADKGFIAAGFDTSYVTKDNIVIKGYLFGLGSLIKMDSAGNVQWRIRSFPFYYESLKKVQITAGGDFIIAGSTGASNIGKNRYDHEFCLSKISSSGVVKWGIGLGGTGQDWANAVIGTGAGYVGVGNSNSNDLDFTGNHNPGSNDGLAVKLDQNGVVVWKKMFGGTGNDTIHAILQSADGGLIMAGSATSADGDVPGNHGQADGWLFKTDSDGNILWKKNFGGSANDVIENILFTADSGIIATGFTFSNDGDISGNHGKADVWVIKTDKNGNLIWSKCFGGSADDCSLGLSATGSDAVLLSGFTESGDGDVSGKNGSGNADGWLLMVSSGGNLIWQKCAGTNDNEYGLAAIALSEHAFLLAGTGYNRARLTPGYDKMLVYLGNSNTIKGTVFLDANSNGIKDAGEVGFNAAFIKTVNSSDNSVKTAIPYQGQFSIDVGLGTFTSSLAVNHPYFNAVPVSHNSTFGSYNNADVVNFAMQPLSQHQDLTITALPLNAASAARTVYYKVVFGNVGNQTVSNETVKIIKDRKTTLDYVTPAPMRQNGDTLEWDYSQLLPMDTGAIYLQMQIGGSAVVHIGDTLYLRAMISPVAGDETPSDDTALIKQVIIGPYDPNDKTEMNGGVITPQQVADGDYLHYLIRFQNTGNDTAYNIYVRDTLEARLDWNTLEMVSASHPYNLQIADGNKITWTFNNALLVDSVHNEPASHGYIAYRIKPLPTVPAGDTIHNSASIYFDFNLPVKTNNNATLVASNLALPVNLLNWNAVLRAAAVDLNWTTSYENNASHFEIERSNDGGKFVSLGSVAAANSRSGASYHFSDPGFATGNNYYRLKTVDLDGGSGYSNILLIKPGAEKALRVMVYPNPADGFISVSLQGELKNNTAISVFDLSGRELMRYPLGNLQASSYSKQVDVHTLAAGVYVLQVQSGDLIRQSKLVVK